MKRTRIIAGLAAVAVAAVGLAGCSSSGSASSDTIKIAYQKFGAFQQLDAQMKVVKKKYEKDNPGKKVTLVPIQAQGNDYYTKLALMNKAPATAPDVMYEDTFLVKADAAGRLPAAARQVHGRSGTTGTSSSTTPSRPGEGEDGKTYGVPMGTDTRALWYNKDIFKKAGLPVPWQPKTWDDVLAAAEDDQGRSCPTSSRSTSTRARPQGEASTMQGFEMLLYGADGSGNTLYKDKKWVTGSKQFEDSLGSSKDVYQGGLGPTPQQALDTNVGTTIAPDVAAEGQARDRPRRLVAVAARGSSPAPTPWPEWNDVMGQARDADAERSGPGLQQHVGRLDPGGRREVEEPAGGVRLHHDASSTRTAR